MLSDFGARLNCNFKLLSVHAATKRFISRSLVLVSGRVARERVVSSVNKLNEHSKCFSNSVSGLKINFFCVHSAYLIFGRFIDSCVRFVHLRLRNFPSWKFARLLLHQDISDKKKPKQIPLLPRHFSYRISEVFGVLIRLLLPPLIHPCRREVFRKQQQAICRFWQCSQKICIFRKCSDGFSDNEINTERTLHSRKRFAAHRKSV